MNIHRFTAGLAHRIASVQTRCQQGYAVRRDRGDVPGWVLITVMTAGLVTVLWAFAGPALVDLFRKAINGVTGR